MTKQAEPWEAKVAQARAACDAGLARVDPPLKGIPEKLPLNSLGLPKMVFTARELEITENYTVIQLLAALRERKISVEEVIQAFLRRAALAHSATNCVADLIWDQAVGRARYLDSLPEPQGALFGLPISTKEHHCLIGSNVETTACFVGWVGKDHGSNPLYEILWKEGCVFYARTTQPQTIMHLETESNVYGRTVNAFNRGLTPGASTEGERLCWACAQGVGGDIGGSIRCPAAHVGVYGFKPTNKRISVLGQRSHMAGKEAIMSRPGPMTRASKEVSEACRKAGMRVVDWNCKSLNYGKGWEILASLYWSDGGEHVKKILAGTSEPELPLTKFIIDEQPSVKNLTQQNLWDRCVEREQYRESYAHAWNATADDGQEVDVILCHPSFGAATPHGQSRYWGYTANWNLLDYPAVVFPITTVDPVKHPKDISYVPKNDEDRFMYGMYSPEKFVDAPVSLQLVGRRQMDKKVLAARTEVERAMGRA